LDVSVYIWFCVLAKLAISRLLSAR